ncbi:tetratricopeptide repeat protein [Aerosakkonemataceae cyanobacterium BLCC-F50]|uniref:Tetratricopeptide repeat protein n=1 Tax=Floridaenema flaviceps BLCC-F50 TaxID=3153642 RepID=A0ABV4Y1F1_9CYAN
MDEQRIAAYGQLIQKLLLCSNDEKYQILNNHYELLDPGLLQMIIGIAKQADDDGYQNIVKFLTNLALELGEWLGSETQPKAIKKRTADILFDWANEQYNLSQFLVACQCLQQSLIIYQAIHDRQGEAASLGCLAVSLGRLGNTYDSLGESERAIAFHEKSLAIFQEIKDRQGEATSLGGLGLDYFSLGQYERAIDFHEKSLAISREIKDRQGEATSLGNLGIAYFNLGQ